MTVPPSDLPYSALPVLWDINSDEARQAIKDRMHAFHEAGHVWAAYRSGLAPQTASRLDDGPAFLGRRASNTEWIAAMGPYVQGLLVEADRVRVEDGVPAHDLEVLFEGDHDQFDAGTIHAHIVTLQHSCCCRRGGDALATARLNDLERVERDLVAVVIDWTNIEALASPLLAGRTLDEDAIHELMRTQPR